MSIYTPGYGCNESDACDADSVYHGLRLADGKSASGILQERAIAYRHVPIICTRRSFDRVTL